MNENINLCEILKDTPKGTLLYSPLIGEVKFDEINNLSNFPVQVIDKKGGKFEFTQQGTFSLSKGECLLFPSKDQRDWSKYPRPFVNGDVITSKGGGIVIFSHTQTHFECSNVVYYHCVLYPLKKFTLGLNYGIGGVSDCRFATEEEKQKLFQAIKDNGYKWNAETKTLEKINDVKEDKGNISDGYHTFNELYEYRLLYNASMFNELAKQGLYDVHKSKKHSDGTIPFDDENWFIVQAELPTGQISNHYEIKDWDLFEVPIKEKANPYDGHTPQDVAKRLRKFLSLGKLVVPKFKVGDRIKHKDDKTVITITGIKDDYYFIKFYNIKKNDYQNEKVSFKDQDNYELVKIEPKFKVGDRIRHKTTNKDDIYEISKVYDDSYGLVGFTWMIYMKYQDDYELVPNKFDIYTLKPFDKVLVRNGKQDKWQTGLFSYLEEKKLGIDYGSYTKYFKGITTYNVNSDFYNYCIPYNYDTKHLVGTTKEAPEFYQIEYETSLID